ncbi:c-type cytochrome [Achromobacter xylosoxidans]|uniref:c-type cytochrome n=1 Tax=Alcaligenes xylosoxydans xylosoxydans TaxID=85698 RepID=UPI0009712B92|nr:cytochrome c [Achromobacter xylosoxidans]MCZ8438871.1 cytochrome c [Achromobacter xylosoxidans]MDC6162406.1 cytochrome c [Achromobacter xylosoxidans]OMG81814.1 cytochrome C [Achromobacter xylosoxidans]CUR68045.1 Cytochrome c555 [Achromobacter xylosoxidans]
MSLAIRLALAAGLAVGGLAHAAADAPAQLDPAGEKLYRSACVVCHASGVANAPKLGDKQAWAPFLALGADALLATVLKGKGAMPPRGGTAADEATLRAAVAYMMDAAR